jgi:hypothetical protein
MVNSGGGGAEGGISGTVVEIMGMEIIPRF